MTSPQIVLFDIDGTLLRGAGPQHKEALIYAAKSELGVACTLDGIDTAGCLDPDLLRLMLANAGVHQRRITVKMAKIMEAAQHYYSTRCKADFSSYICAGVKLTLEMLEERGVALGLVTGNLSAIAWRKLENAGIDHHFRFGAFAEQARTRSRLAKLAVQQAKQMNLVSRRYSVSLVGDHGNDIEAARSNGFRSIAVATGLTPAADLMHFHPDVLVETLDGATYELICGQD